MHSSPVTPVTAPLRPPSARRSTARTTRRWLPLLEAAAVVLLMLGAVGGYLGVGRFWAGQPTAAPGATPVDAASSAAMWGGNAARSGEQPGPGPEAPVGIRWQRTLEDGFSGSASLVAAAGRLYHAGFAVPEAGSPAGPIAGLAALDAATGEPLWQTGLAVFGSPAVRGTLVYVTVLDTLSRASALVAVHAASGEEAWRVETGDWAGGLATSPIVDDASVYVADPDGTVYARDATSGAERWTSTAARSDASRMESRDAAPGTTPGATGTFAVGNGAVYVVNGRGDLHALDAATGEALWAIDVRERFRLNPEIIYPVAVDDAVVVALRGFDANSRTMEATSIVAALDAADGQGLWSKEFPKLFAGVAVAGDTVLAPLADAIPRLVALDLKTGDPRWEFAAAGSGGITPTVAGGTVFLAGEAGTVRALNLADGKEQWRIDLGGVVPFPPVVADGWAFVVGSPSGFNVGGPSTITAIAAGERGGTPPAP